MKDNSKTIQKKEKEYINAIKIKPQKSSSYQSMQFIYPKDQCRLDMNLSMMENLKTIKSTEKEIKDIVMEICTKKYKFSYIGEFISDFKEGKGTF